MCVVSMIGDTWRTGWPTHPLRDPLENGTITRGEFEALKREVELLKDLLRAARIYDAENGEPDCEVDEKMDMLRKIAEKVGVDLNEVD